MGRIGDELLFVITVGNRGSLPAVNVVVNDTLPVYLDILGVSADRGVVSVSGHTVTVKIGTVEPGEIITIRIRTRINELAPAPLVGFNTAVLTTSSASDNPGNNVAIAEFRVVLVDLPLPPVPVPPQLPRTAEPADRGPAPTLALLGLILLVAGLALRRRARS